MISFYIPASLVWSHMHAKADVFIISSISTPDPPSPTRFFILSIPLLSLTRFPSTFLLHLYISSSLSNCVVSMHLQVLLFLIDTKLDLVRITFTLNILRLQSEEKKKLLSQLYRTAMPSINNQQYWKKNSCRFYYYSIPHPLSITITDSRYTKDWFMKQNSFSCVGQDIYVFTQNILYNKTSVFAQQD